MTQATDYKSRHPDAADLMIVMDNDEPIPFVDIYSRPGRLTPTIWTFPDGSRIVISGIGSDDIMTLTIKINFKVAGFNGEMFQIEEIRARDLPVMAEFWNSEACCNVESLDIV